MKKTKIVATISDLRCDPAFIRQLYEAGMDVARLNTAHQSPESSEQIVKNIRSVSDKIAIMIDTKGPELRTCKVKEEFTIAAQSEILVQGDPEAVSHPGCIYVKYHNFVNEVPVGSSILIEDGIIELYVKEKKDNALVCIAQNDGIIKSNKNINIPGVNLNLPTLNEKDKSYIDFAIKNDVDFIAHSFVRNKEDLLEIQKLLDEKQSKIKIIAKIENQQGVGNIDNILNHCYGVMVARGDLAVEIPYERIPIIQRELVQKCIEKRKPVIIATQMLHSMINNPRPTRAEVTDVANAVYSQTDAIMLSNETAGGRYPILAVKTMARIAEEIEKHKEPYNDIKPVTLSSDISAFLTKSAVRGSIKLNAAAIIADTETGRTIRNIAAFRGSKVVFARCYDKRVMRELSLSYGISADYMEMKETTRDFIQESITTLLKEKKLSKDSLVVVVAGNFGTHHGASFVEISTVENLTKVNK